MEVNSIHECFEYVRQIKTKLPEEKKVDIDFINEKFWEMLHAILTYETTEQEHLRFTLKGKKARYGNIFKAHFSKVSSSRNSDTLTVLITRTELQVYLEQVVSFSVRSARKTIMTSLYGDLEELSGD